MQTVKQIWNTWDIRVFLFVSLLIQILLTFLAPFRKRCVSVIFSTCVWLLYLSADAVALFAIGLISSSQGVSPHKSELLAFWAPFLLLHLGGPDTITALALEDNELWLRHALQLATQAGVTIYVFGQSVRTHNNRLWVPTLLMSVAGFIKYVERTCALYFASSDSFKNSLTTGNEPGVKSSKSISSLPQTSSVTETDMLIHAYTSYKMFKGILVDSVLTFETRDSSRDFFLGIAPHQGLRITEIESNLIHDIFFSKVSLLLLNKRVYFVLGRVVVFLSVVASLFLFGFKDKSKYHRTDVGITYYLLIGAVLLDFYAGLRVIVADWWWIVIVPTLPESSLLKSIPWRVRILFATSRRWSSTISRCNLLACCTHDLPSYFNYIFIERVKDALTGWLYVQSEPIDDKLVAFITEEIHKKVQRSTENGVLSEDAIDQLRSTRGSLVLQTEYPHLAETVQLWTTALEYDKSLLAWHVATDICSRADDSSENKGTTGEALYHQLSKQLSEYMLYIILRQQPMVSSIAGYSDIRFDWTVQIGKKLITRYRNKKRLPEEEDHREKELHQLATLLLTEGTNSDIWQEVADFDQRSVLDSALSLAEQIQKFGKNKWEITSKVWVELLCYAAIRSAPRFHVARLNAGGELLTTTWLFLAHLGLAGQFQAVNRVQFGERATALLPPVTITRTP